MLDTATDIAHLDERFVMDDMSNYSFVTE